MGNLFAKIQDFFLNKALGRLIVRASVSIAAYAASGKLGAVVALDPAQLAGLMVSGANALLTLLKPRVSALANVAPIPVPSIPA